MDGGMEGGAAKLKSIATAKPGSEPGGVEGGAHLNHWKRRIQSDKGRHDSVKDAQAAMDLTLLKISKGPGFGKRLKPNFESLIEVLGRHGCRTSLIDRRPILHQYAVGSCNAIIANSDEEEAGSAGISLPEGLRTVLARLDDRFNKFYDALEPNTLLIVATGHGYTSSVRRLQELKWIRQGSSQKWSKCDEDVQEEIAARAETTLVFTCIK
ncbi:small RNA degrading nuclease 5-like [Physcomitrium patens]|uniref:small RNA degrading nuclease 5-like n=1 Tax=Physcomitrium patens TaxID=3218 RepID=UPI003CCD2538